MGSRSAGLVAAIFTTTLAVDATARAALCSDPPLPQGVEIRWSGASGCPDRSQIEARIARRLAAQHGEMQAVVVIALAAETDGSYSLDLTVETPSASSSRRLEASECELLAEATALIVAIAVDPRVDAERLRETIAGSVEAAAAERRETAADDDVIVPEVRHHEADAAGDRQTQSPLRSSTIAADEARGADAPPASLAPLPTRRERQPIALAARLIAGGGGGVLPGFGGGIGAAAAVVGVAWRAEAQFSRWFSQPATFSDSSIGANFDLWSAGVRGCGVPSVGPVAFPICVGPELGRIRARGYGAPVNLERRALWTAIVLAPAVTWTPRNWIALWVGVDGFVNLIRPGFGGQSRGEVYRSARVGGRVVAGVEFRVLARGRRAF